MKPTIENILDFVAEYSGRTELNENSDIESDLGVYGDDWEDLMMKFRDTYHVDMDTYLWYFHSGEEGFSIGSIFVKPPYERVKRIAITPNDLFRIATKGKWDIVYPEHELPKKRYDIMIGTVVFVLFIIWLIWYGLK